MDKTLFAFGNWLSELWKIGCDHLVIQILVAVILILLGYFGRRLADLSAWLVTVKVRGKWLTFITRAGIEEPHETAKLHQFLNTVWGTTRTKDLKAYKIYKVKGRLSGNKLALVYREVSGGFDAGAILLDVSAGGNNMLGTEVGCNLQTNACEVFGYRWERPPND